MVSNYTNFTNLSTYPQMPIDIVLVGSILYIIVLIFGLFGNFLVIYVLMRNKDLRNFTNYLLANLSIAELLVLITNVPIGLHDLYADERWYLGKTMCQLVYFFENCMSFASILSIFFITFERFYVICRPLSVKSLMTHSLTLKLILIIWFTSILLNFPLALLPNYEIDEFNNKKNGFKCEVRADSKAWRRVYLILITFVFYLFIGFFISYMYIRISKNLKRSTFVFTSHKTDCITSSHSKISINRNSSFFSSNKNIKNNQRLLKERSSQISKSSDGRSSKNCEEPILNINNNLEKYIKPRKQLIKMLMHVVIMFYICLFPLKTWNIVFLFSDLYPSIYSDLGIKIYWYINVIVHFCFYLNSMINPILYNFMSKKFRNSFKKIEIFSFCASGQQNDESFELPSIMSLRFYEKKKILTVT